MVRKKQESQTLQQFSSIVFFVAIAALFWLMIKLSSNYVVTEPLTINIKDTPSDLVVTNGTQKLNVTLSSSGFELLNYYFKPLSRRKVDISLEEVPLHKDGESTYSFSSSYAKDKVAKFLDLEPNKVAFDDNRIILTMEQLDSIRVKVTPDIVISYEKQYEKYGKTITSPDSVTVYGPKNKLKSIDKVFTQNIVLKDVSSNVDIEVPLLLDEFLNSNNKNVNVKIFVEKYTEAMVNVKINNPSQKKLRLFPDKVTIKYVVSLTDYKMINENHFVINIDTAYINQENKLPVQINDYPSNTRITNIQPKEVEYIIIEEDEN